MRVVLQAFLQELNDLKQHIYNTENEIKLLANMAEAQKNENSETIESIIEILSSGKRRRFHYNSIIISLYGFLEQFIELLIKEYVGSLNTTIPSYNLLPASIIKNHIELSFGLISRAEQSKYHGEIKAEDIVANLHSGLSASGNYKINAEAFTYHTANYRADIIDQSFTKLGIESTAGRIKKVPFFSKYLKDTYTERINSEQIYYYLNDLAERRNEVAHGSATELLSNEVLIGYIDFLENYGKALFEIINSELTRYLVEYKAVELGKPIAVYKNQIVCLSAKVSIRTGDILIAKTSNKSYPFLSGEIIEIQVDNQIQSEVLPDTFLGMKIPFHAKKNYSFYIVSKE